MVIMVIMVIMVQVSVLSIPNKRKYRPGWTEHPRELMTSLLELDRVGKVDIRWDKNRISDVMHRVAMQGSG